MNKDITSIQYLRAFAAIGVIFFHATMTASKLPGAAGTRIFYLGQTGVDLFFVISGFIITYISVLSPRLPIDFLVARFQRVAPIYWLATVLMFFMPLVSKVIGWNSTLDPWHLVSSLLFIGGAHIKSAATYYPLLFPGWTINYEIFFYLLFGLGLFTKNVWRAALVCGTVIVSLVVIGMFLRPPLGIISFYTAPIMLEFLLGAIIGLAATSDLRIPKAICIAGIVIGGLCFLAQLQPDLNVRALKFGVPATMIVAGCVFLEAQGGMYRSALLRRLGDASYSQYLSHVFTQSFVFLVLNRLGVRDSAFAVICMTFVSIVIGLCCYSFIERPTQAWFRKLSTQKQHRSEISRHAKRVRDI